MKILLISRKQTLPFRIFLPWLFIFFLELLSATVCTDLTQFQLPPCCYGQTPFLDQAASSESVVTVTTEHKEAEPRKINLDPAQLTEPNVTSSVQGNMHRFVYPMGSFGISNKTMAEPAIRSRYKSANLSNNSTSSMFDKVVEIETKSDSNGSAFRMPANWELHLRQALYQSMNATRTEKAASRTVESETDTDTAVSTLWQNIRDAPLEVIEPSTRKPSSNRIPELELATSRISGVMVNTKNGVELRASASTFPVPIPPTVGECDCHLIHHGDALLAYWSVANSDGNNAIEYLIYPVPHNIPTPPVFLPFHTDKILKPSPIDHNPALAYNSDSREIPFQASLEFGANINSVNTPQILHESVEQNLIGLNSDILHNSPQRYGIGIGLGHQTQQIIENAPVKTTDIHHHFHHVGEPFGIYPGAGPGIPPFPHPHFPQLHHPDQVRQFRKLTHGPGPLPGPIYENQPPVGLPPPLLDHPNSIQEIITEQGPPPLPHPGPGPGFGIPPPPPGHKCGPGYPGCPAEFGPFPGPGPDYRPGPGPDYRPGPGPDYRPDYDPNSPPGSDVGRPRPGDPDYGRYPGDPGYTPRPGSGEGNNNGGYPENTRPGDPDYRPRPGDPDYRPRPGDPDYGRYPGDPNYDRYPGDQNYRPRPGDPNYDRYPGDPNYRPRPGDPNYDRYPGDPNYDRYPGDSNYNRPRPENSYAERFPENPEYYRPYPPATGGIQNRPNNNNNNPPRQSEADRHNSSPPKLKFSMGLGVGSTRNSGKIRFLDSKNQLSSASNSNVHKREKKFFPAKGTESTYILKF